MTKPTRSRTLTFDVSTGLKRVLGRELITDDEVAIFELVKNSFDAGAKTVHLHFGDDNVIVADNGSGMSLQDLEEKWLVVAYSTKRTQDSSKDFRDLAAERKHFAGSKGIGRFSSDRLGRQLVLHTRAGNGNSGIVHRIEVDWGSFEKDEKARFEEVPLRYTATDGFEIPDELKSFKKGLDHGTIIEISSLSRSWDRPRLRSLKASLAKLINPFGDRGDLFKVIISAPAELEEDKKIIEAAKQKGEEPLPMSRQVV